MTVPIPDSADAPQGLAVAVQTPVPPTVLCVDDEPNILASLRRALRTPDLCILTAGSGAEGLAMLRETPIDVVISDMRMPGMDGALFLEQVQDAWPDTIRILLTGHADMSAAVAAVNRGRIHRYFNKPWDESELRAAVHQGLERVALQRDKDRLEALTQQQNLALRALNEHLEERVQERTQELAQANRKLKSSFLTSIKVFSNVLELRGGRLGGHGRRVAAGARSIAQAMGLDEAEKQDLFVAALLHDIGHIGLPDAMLAKPVARMEPEELAQYQQHPVLGEQLLMPLDDLHGVAAIIHEHHERYDGLGYPDRKAGIEISRSARILAVADAFDELQDGHLGGAMPNEEEAQILLRQGRGTQFDPEVVDVFLQIRLSEHRQAPASGAAVPMATGELAPGMVLAADFLSPQGVLLLVAGHVLTEPLIRRIRQFEIRTGQPIRLQIRIDPLHS